MTHPSPTALEELDAIRKRHERDRNVIHSVFHKDSMATENFNDRGALLTHLAALEAELATRLPPRKAVARAIMLEVQHGDFGHYEDDPADAERKFVCTGEQIDNLTRCCDKAAERVLALLSGAATPAPTAALTEEELLTPELIKKAADAGERVGWNDVLTPNAQIYHRAIDLKKYETALRAVLPIIIDRLAKSPPQGAEE